MADVVIYTKAYCPFCVRAIALLKSKQVSFQEIRIDVQPELRPQMIEKSGGRTTVPQIFINDHPIGGCDDLVALEAAGKLDPLLN
ncbi:glutaredoxin 3 [Alkalimonas delamerensis]|uniref:Glutaredoxin n=1 Tax=Alkalimonas delamerensis TaxID=265981 RepID=A0ABT9GKT6_9GAMM|nr:glutaredoxin 3 [Alkalimonas delamerensis]MDP4527582.1 glutaredoxin 3 [Alkalimonas delamerensis]